jgi:signal recognition particle GTPase
MNKMTIKYRSIYCAIGLIAGIIGGVAGTAFTMGAERQRINDTLTKHTTEMEAMKVADTIHEQTTQKELDRFAEIIGSRMTQIQSEIVTLTNTVNNLRTDVQVMKAIMERMEEDLNNKSISD